MITLWIDNMAKEFDTEDMKDPWGGNLKIYRIVHSITEEVFGETNSSFTAEAIQEANPDSMLINQWSEHNTMLLFFREDDS